MLREFVEYVQGQWAELMKAPGASIVAAVLTLGIGFAGGMLVYSSQVDSLHEEINAKDGEIDRYRVALGIDPAKSALIELTNKELQEKERHNRSVFAHALLNRTQSHERNSNSIETGENR